MLITLVTVCAHLHGNQGGLLENRLHKECYKRVIIAIITNPLVVVLFVKLFCVLIVLGIAVVVITVSVIVMVLVLVIMHMVVLLCLARAGASSKSAKYNPNCVQDTSPP